MLFHRCLEMTILLLKTQRILRLVWKTFVKPAPANWFVSKQAMTYQGKNIDHWGLNFRRTVPSEARQPIGLSSMLFCTPKRHLTQEKKITHLCDEQITHLCDEICDIAQLGQSSSEFNPFSTLFFFFFFTKLTTAPETRKLYMATPIWTALII